MFAIEFRIESPIEIVNQVNSLIREMTLETAVALEEISFLLVSSWWDPEGARSRAIHRKVHQN